MRIWVVIFSALLLTACASKKESPMSNEPVVRALFTQLNEWKGTPYRYGGNTKSGIDCSAFVQITYTTLFNKNLPRSTTEQAQLGTKIKPKEHRPGDLIFFRTEGSKQINHVGIYAENNTFIHASTSKGVTRSSLNNPYWQKNYVYSRRVTNLASFM
ncbi:C40 family peptidase [Thorsellia kenyensis]|uniref:C40 family peptidase n=1 Tax=Thorsellia kenyensis TaxID=1549888 RepID=A0ABV6CD42_9GAMM